MAVCRMLVVIFLLSLSACGGGGGGGGGNSKPTDQVSLLDTTFGMDDPSSDDPEVRLGYALFHNPVGGNLNNIATAVVVGADDKIYVTGQRDSLTMNMTLNVNMALWRYNSDGTLDTGFGDDDPNNSDPTVRLGYTVFDNATGSSVDVGRAIVIDGKGRIIIAGETPGAFADMVVWCYTPDGMLDTSFGDDDPSNADPAVKLGYTVHNGAAGGNGEDAGMSLLVDGDGNIVVAGYSVNADWYMTLWRYSSDGILDKSFGDDDPTSSDPAVRKGFAVFNNPQPIGDTYGYGIALDSDGKYLVTGYAWDKLAGFERACVWRYNPDGSPDKSFGDDDPNVVDPAVKLGVVITKNVTTGPGFDHGYKIAVDVNGKILVAGTKISSNPFPVNDMALWRFNADGSLDTTFGDDDPDINDPSVKLGYTIQADVAGVIDANSTAAGNSLAVDEIAGRIYVVGGSRNPSLIYDMVVWAFDADGALDTTFGDVDPGKTNSDIKRGFTIIHNTAGGHGNDYGKSITLDGNRKILVAGSSTNAAGNSNMVLWRLLP